MKINELNIRGVFEIVLNPILDKRGFFMRTWDQEVFIKNGFDYNWVQENHSRTIEAGTIRGLHLQLQPFSETKLIRCIKGEIFDVFVDLRKDSQTFGMWESQILSEENKKMILLPKGIAHGFCSLRAESELLYKVDNYYKKEYECGIIWNDPDLNIRWPFSDIIVSDKDKKNLTLKVFIKRHRYVDPAIN